MFQVLFPCKEGNSYPFFQQVMPSGWNLLIDDQKDRYLITDCFTKNKIGSLIYIPDLNTALIRADETEPIGENFWRDFGLRYPELNPFDLRFGVLYEPCCEGVYELDELPNDMPPEALDRVAHFGKFDRAYYVTFFLGDWHTGDEIKVQSFCKIEKNGVLGPKLTRQHFKLGSAEKD